MAFEVFSWSMVAISLLGTVLNVRGNACCWYVWAIGNMGWIIVGLGSQVYSLAALQAVYLAMNFWGVKAWKEKGNELQRLRAELAAAKANSASFNRFVRLDPVFDNGELIATSLESQSVSR